MRLILIVVITTLSACADGPETRPDLEYRTIPEALLQSCTLPQLPEDTADLSDVFVQAYVCAELGNKDKQRIRELIEL